MLAKVELLTFFETYGFQHFMLNPDLYIHPTIKRKLSSPFQNFSSICSEI